MRADSDRPEAPTERVPTGTPGLDDVLGGGLPGGGVYLVLGAPGTGKTTLGLQFLLEGRRHGERCLYITLSELKRELESTARSHGWSLQEVRVFESLLSPAGVAEENTVFPPSEVELGERMSAISAEIARARPRRVVLDSATELQRLARDPLRYSRHIHALRKQLDSFDATVLLLDAFGGEQDVFSQTFAHGVLSLERIAPGYGVARRRLIVEKLRGSGFRDGYHDFTIVKGGLLVFPRLTAAEHVGVDTAAQVPSGVEELDALVGGGLDRGRCTLITGPTGVGKTALATLYATASAARGEHAAIFTFDEGIDTMLLRSDALGIPLRDGVGRNLITLKQVDPAELSPGQFVHVVRSAVEERKARCVVIDSLNGYLLAMPDEKYLTIQLHELLTYLGHRGVATLLVSSQHGFLGHDVASDVEVSYLADTILLLRYFEAGGKVRKAISAVKRRLGRHEIAIRELLLGPGLRVGEPLAQFRGVLTGTPEFVGEAGPEGPLMRR